MVWFIAPLIIGGITVITAALGSKQFSNFLDSFLDSILAKFPDTTEIEVKEIGNKMGNKIKDNLENGNSTTYQCGLGDEIKKFTHECKCKNKNGAYIGSTVITKENGAQLAKSMGRSDLRDKDRIDVKGRRIIRYE